MASYRRRNDPADPKSPSRSKRRTLRPRIHGASLGGDRRRSDRRQGERRGGGGGRGYWDRVRERAGDERIQSAREWVHRYRLPIIGLTMAGSALPLSKLADSQRTPPPLDATERVAGELNPLRDVGRRWSDREAEQIRSDTVEGAVVRYDIERDLAEDIFDIAIEEGIEPDVAFGLVNTESTFKPRAVSNVGARGLAQLMPRTAEELMPGVTGEDLFDREINLHLGFRYLKGLVDKYDGDMRLALLAYNRGPGTVDRVLSQGGDPNNGYADAVLSG